MVENFRPQTYPSEFHPHIGESWYRASCTRCHPTWRGPWYKFSSMIPYLLNGRRRDPETVDAELREKVYVDMQHHADLLHQGTFQ